MVKPEGKNQQEIKNDSYLHNNYEDVLVFRNQIYKNVMLLMNNQVAYKESQGQCQSQINFMGSKLYRYIYHEILNPRITPLSGLPLVFIYIDDIDIKNKK